MLHGGETWGPNVSELQRLRRNDRSMIRWMCGTKARDETPSEKLLKKLGLCDITAVLRCGRLRWSGHVERATSYINTVTKLVVPGKRGRGRPRKTWAQCVKNDIHEYGFTEIDPQDRESWRRRVKTILVPATS